MGVNVCFRVQDWRRLDDAFAAVRDELWRRGVDYEKIAEAWNDAINSAADAAYKAVVLPVREAGDGEWSQDCVDLAQEIRGRVVAAIHSLHDFRDGKDHE